MKHKYAVGMINNMYAYEYPERVIVLDAEDENDACAEAYKVDPFGDILHVRKVEEPEDAMGDES